MRHRVDSREQATGDTKDTAVRDKDKPFAAAIVPRQPRGAGAGAAADGEGPDFEDCKVTPTDWKQRVAPESTGSQSQGMMAYFSSTMTTTKTKKVTQIERSVEKDGERVTEKSTSIVETVQQTVLLLKTYYLEKRKLNQRN